MSGRSDPHRDDPLRAWGDALRRDREARSRLIARVLLTVVGCAALLLTTGLPPRPRLVWNASASAPIGLYSVSPGIEPQVGDMVVARLPADARLLAATRHYLPPGVPLVKRVAAGPGDQVCADGVRVTIDGDLATVRHVTDPLGRPMPWWSGCRWLRDNQYLLLMTDVPSSFDGRYFGISNGSEIIGPARLLWRR